MQRAGARGRFASVVINGLVGGALGAALYEVIAALISPDGRTYQPIASAWQPRLLAATVGPILIAALAASALVGSAEACEGGVSGWPGRSDRTRRSLER